MVEYCTSTSGTNLNAYDMLKDVLDALHSVVDKSITILNWISTNFSIVLESMRIAIPILSDGVNAVPLLEAKKFWAIRIHFMGETVDLPLPKKSINDLWRDAIAPYDYWIPGTEYLLYYDETMEADFKYKSGVYFTPNKQLGILSDLPSLIKDIGLVYIIYRIFVGLGLVGIAKSFVNYFTVTKKYRRILNGIDDVSEDINEIDEDIEALKTLTTDELLERIAAIESLLGVKLLLR